VAVGDGSLISPSFDKTNRGFTSPQTESLGRHGVTAALLRPPRLLYDVAYGAGRFVAVDDEHNFYTSTTAITWTKTTNSSAGSRVSYCNGLFIVPSGPGTNLVSSDGVSWSLLTNTTASYFGRVIYAGGCYLALAYSTAFTSTDGTNWVQRNLHAPPTGLLRQPLLGPRNFIAVGTAYAPLPALPFAFSFGSHVALSMNPGLPPQLNVSGLSRRSIASSISDIQSTNWQTVGTLTLSNSPATGRTRQRRMLPEFYRAVLFALTPCVPGPGG